jgi:NADH-quinone oxidoreductase subunit A
MLTDYLPIAVLITFSTLLAVAVIVIGHLFGPHRPTPVKLEPYESGIQPFGPAMRRMPARFYLIAVLFILFDIETIFFLPWAVTYQTFIHRSLGVFAFGEMLVFVGILLVGYVWVWKKGALEWV